MVEHHIFILLKEKTQQLHNEYYKLLFLYYSVIGVIIFSLCCPLILLHHVRNGFLLICPHVFPISAGLQLTLFLEMGRAGPLTPLVCRPVPGSSGSRQVPISFLGARLTRRTAINLKYYRQFRRT